VPTIHQETTITRIMFCVSAKKIDVVLVMLYDRFYLQISN
jgi:hypothetical protein